MTSRTRFHPNPSPGTDQPAGTRTRRTKAAVTWSAGTRTRRTKAAVTWPAGTRTRRTKAAVTWPAGSVR